MHRCTRVGFTISRLVCSASGGRPVSRLPLLLGSLPQWLPQKFVNRTGLFDSVRRLHGTLVGLADTRDEDKIRRSPKRSPPPCRPSIGPVGASRNDVMPSEGEQREQQRADADGRNQEAP